MGWGRYEWWAGLNGSVRGGGASLYNGAGPRRAGPIRRKGWGCGCLKKEGAANRNGGAWLNHGGGFGGVAWSGWAWSGGRGHHEAPPPGEHHLRITAARLEDDGVWQCQAGGGNGTAGSRPALLTVMGGWHWD